MMLAAVLVAAHAAPAAEQTRPVRQVQAQAPFNGPNSPLSQLLQDSLLVSTYNSTFFQQKTKTNFFICSKSQIRLFGTQNL